jgi:hypothetical protein
LIDNKIAKAVGLKSLSSKSYVEWMKKLKSWLQNYVEAIEQLEKECDNFSILKLVDEGLYMMCSITLRKRVSELGL